MCNEKYDKNGVYCLPKAMREQQIFDWSGKNPTIFEHCNDWWILFSDGYNATLSW